MKKKNKSDVEFEILIAKKADKLLVNFFKKLEKERVPIELISEEDGRLNTLLSTIHNSNKDLNKYFFEIQKKVSSDKKLSYSQAIFDYCKKNINKQKELWDFSTSILSLHKARSIVISNMPKSRGETDFDQIENSIPINLEFTLARKVLMLSFLMTKHFDGNLTPDKTTIARFIESLISEKISKEISNSNLYSKVKTLFFNQSEANKKDIQYVRNIFQNLGFTDLVNDIDKLLEVNKIKN